MSRSPHRFRADAAEAWCLLLFGEALRALEDAGEEHFVVRAGESVKLPRSGRWQTGLAVLRPALDDDVLGDTALAVAWRWACADVEANAWPSIGLVARKALRRPPAVAEQRPWAMAEKVMLAQGGGGDGHAWTLELPEPVAFRVEGASGVDFSRVDRVADIAAAWFDVGWARSTP